MIIIIETKIAIKTSAAVAIVTATKQEEKKRYW